MNPRTSSPTRSAPWPWLLQRLTALSWAYCTLLVVWLALQQLAGDRWWWLFGLNALAIYLFLPVPLVVLLALLTRQRGPALAASVSFAVGFWLFGALVLPAWPQPAAAGTPLRVMSYNVLGFNSQPERVIAVIEQANADVVTFQELNPAIAVALQQQLLASYPYQLLDPQEGVSGMGVISRYPLAAHGAELAGDWVGQPQILALQVAEQQVTLVHIHAAPTTPAPPAYMEASIRLREEETQILLEFLATQPGPVLVAGDFNATAQNYCYRQLTRVLRDAWYEAGWGLGHTFPGGDSPDGSRPKLAGINAPSWLVRIDYIFYSRHWSAVGAAVGLADGVSDHRPVVAELVLLPSTPS